MSAESEYKKVILQSTEVGNSAGKDQKPPILKLGHKKVESIHEVGYKNMQPLSSNHKYKGGNKSSVNFLCVYVIAKYDVFLLI